MSKTSEPALNPPTASDIVIEHWVLRAAPAKLRPYLKLARVDRPIGTWLLLFPCWWSMALALQTTGGISATGPADWLPALLFAFGALVMRGAGCTINDIADRNIDAKVARTATRPLPSGQVSLAQALVFLALLLAAGLAVLLQFNGFTVGLGALALLLVVPYPLMKRITYWPQAWLGLTFNWGALVGWTAVAGELGWPALLLYLGGIAWTLGYDTIYAHQDKEDDALVGVKSSALKLGAGSKPWLAGFYAAAAALMLAAGLSAGLGWPFWLAVALLAAQMTWQVADLKLDDPKDCLAKFKSNRLVGWILLTGMILGGLAA